MSDTVKPGKSTDVSDPAKSSKPDQPHNSIESGNSGSSSESAVLPWVEAYLPDFAQILRIIERTPGFAFQPLELPSPDLARVLARWLDQHGIRVSTLELSDERSWESLARDLENLGNPSDPDNTHFDDIDRPRASTAREGHKPNCPEYVQHSPAAAKAKSPAVALVIAGAESPPESLVRRALAQVNMGRDVIARRSAQTILWCGDARFQHWTGDFAPDLWSVGSSPYFIPLRRIEDLLPAQRASAGLWWTGAADHDVCDLEQTYKEEPKGRTKVQTGLQLAEARITHGDYVGAQDLLREVAPEVLQKAPLLLARLGALAGVAQASQGPQNDGSSAEEQRLRRKIDKTQALGAGPGVEAQLRMTLANTIGLQNPHRAQEALEETLAARALYLDQGDTETALQCSYMLFTFAQPLPPELLRSLEDQARATLEQNAKPARSIRAELILIRIAIGSQRLEEAEHHLQRAFEAIEDSPELAVFKLDAQNLATELALRQGALERALEHARSLLSLAEEAEHHLQRAFEAIEDSPELAVFKLEAQNFATVLALRQGALERALEHAHSFLSLAEKAELPVVELAGHRVLARVLRMQESYLPAAIEIDKAIDISIRLQDPGIFADFSGLEFYARQLGDLRVADLLLAYFGQVWVREIPDFEQTWLHPRMKQLEASGLRIPTRTRTLHSLIERFLHAANEQESQEAICAIAAEATRLAEELAHKNVDLFDPHTWSRQPTPDKSLPSPNSTARDSSLPTPKLALTKADPKTHKGDLPST